MANEGKCSMGTYSERGLKQKLNPLENDINYIRERILILEKKMPDYRYEAIKSKNKLIFKEEELKSYRSKLENMTK